jgi:threonyl-tRNA synthetase
MNITDKQSEYCQKIAKKLKENGFRAKLDLRNEKIGFKIREHSMRRVPYLLIIGDKELDDQTIAVRSQKGEDLGSLQIATLVERLDKEIADKE